jgi:hypothetical protein
LFLKAKQSWRHFAAFVAQAGGESNPFAHGMVVPVVSVKRQGMRRITTTSACIAVVVCARNAMSIGHANPEMSRFVHDVIPFNTAIVFATFHCLQIHFPSE